LVVEANSARVLALWDDNHDGRNDNSERAVLAAAAGLNQGIAINGGFLYASSATTVFRWRYVAGMRTNLGAAQTVISNIPGGGHSTRSIAFDNDGLLYVSVGSAGNVDQDSRRSRIVRFDVSTVPLNWANGEVFADGLRNEVGMALDNTGVMWGVENGCDNLQRSDLGGDIHDDNPGEEVNKFVTPGRFYGYPYCWSEYILPDFGLGVDTQWYHPQFQGTYTDAWCRNTNNVVPPVWSLPAHTAPLDMSFYHGHSFPSQYSGGIFVALHGSWNRNPPQGYRVNFLTVENGVPVKEDPFLRFNGNGERWSNNIRPSGLSNNECRDGSGDTKDCLFVTSDATGHIIKIGYYGN